MKFWGFIHCQKKTKATDLGDPSEILCEVVRFGFKWNVLIWIRLLMHWWNLVQVMMVSRGWFLMILEIVFLVRTSKSKISHMWSTISTSTTLHGLAEHFVETFIVSKQWILMILAFLFFILQPWDQPLGLEQNVSTTFGWITMKFGADVPVTFWMNCYQRQDHKVQIAPRFVTCTFNDPHQPLS